MTTPPCAVAIASAVSSAGLGRELAPGDARGAAVRVQEIDWCLPMSGCLAGRFGDRGGPLADLIQVTAIGLIKAVDRYDAKQADR